VLLNRREMEPEDVHTRSARTRGALSGLLVLLVGCTTAFAQPSLRSRQDFVVGDHPVAAISVDFDGDGNLDLITANQLTNNFGDVSLMRGFGDGTFRRLATVTVGLLPSGVAFAEATGDGRPDLIVSSFESQKVTVHPGDGFGAFGPEISTGVSGRPSGLAVGDWNADGKIDIATVNDTNVSSMLGDGAGRFGTLRQFTVGSGPRQILTADFSLNTNGTKDGIPDLAVVNNGSATIQIFRGDGTGQFTLSRTLTTGVSPFSMVAADFNADNRLDVAVANFGADSVGVYLANSSGAFLSPSLRSTGFGPRGLAAADLNKDGSLDLVVSQGEVSNVGEVAVLNGNGAGVFTLQPLVQVGPKPNVVTAADFNKDGNVDLATLSLTGNTIGVLQNLGTGSFLEANKIVLPIGAFPHGVAMTDLNQDTRADVATANEATDSLSVTTGNGQCGFGAVTSNINTGITPFGLVVGDFNEDGCADLLTPNNGNDTVTRLQNNCAAGFSVSNLAAGCLGPVAASSGDVNGDLNADFAVVCEASNQICTRRGTGTGSFGVTVCTVLTQVPGGVAIGHYNLDAFEDAAVTSQSLGLVATCISDGAGGCVEIPPPTFPVGPAPQGIVQRDLNGDGYRDLLVANSGSDTSSALLGDGGGVFSYPSIDSLVGLAPTAIVVADFNIDGKIDAAVVNTNANNVSLMLGDGFGNFTKAGDYGTRALPIAIAAADCNGDSKPDLAVADNFSDTVTILVNQMGTTDPLQLLTLESPSNRTTLRWGIVPGGVYDVIRGLVKSVTQGATTFNLGPVTCLANDLVETDTASFPDTALPPLGDALFYLVRATVGGVPGNYTVAAPSGKVGIPSSGSCP
jgi:VCBS repeat protein